MKWKYCNYCPLDGTCENQDRGHECEMPVKKLLEENQQLKELLKTCREMLEEYQYSEGDFTIGDNLEMDTSLLLKMINTSIGEKK